MKIVALVSGGKDSVYNVAKCLAYGHELIVLANLFPPDDGPEELDSFMFQSAGHRAVGLLAECMGVPLIRMAVTGSSRNQSLHYHPTENDEIEDLYALLQQVKAEHPDVEGVASGAVLSTYQRTRVESVCERLSLQSLAYLWQREQANLIDEMLEYGMHAVLVKVCSAGLNPQRHLGKALDELLPVFKKLHKQYDFHIAGEGGEYETLVLDAPFFKRRLVLDSTEIVVHSDDLYAPVGFLRILECHTEERSTTVPRLPPQDRNTHRAGSPSAPAREEPVGGLQREETCTTRSVEDGCRSRRRVRALPTAWVQGRQVWVGGVSGSGSTAAEQLDCALTTLRTMLELRGLSMQDVCFVHLYLRAMSQFGAVNSVYCRAFEKHPPSRSCVEVALPPMTEVLLDAMVLAGSGAEMRRGRFHDRQVLHIKSVSSWAPVCIGPYSQANTLAQHFILLAGQIGLRPATMDIEPRGLWPETRQALRNCAAVLDSLGSTLRTALTVIVYVNVGNVVKGTTDAVRIREADVAAWRRLCSVNADWGSNTPELDDGAESADIDDNSSTGVSDDEDEVPSIDSPPFLVVGVPGLPRDAAIEFEVVALTTAFCRLGLPITCSTHKEVLTVSTERHQQPSPLPLPFQHHPLVMPQVTRLPLLQQPGLIVVVESQCCRLSHSFVTAGVQFLASLASADSSTLQGPAVISYEGLGEALTDQVQTLLQEAQLSWRQLSSIRVFFEPGVLDVTELRSSICVALSIRANSSATCALTLVPVSIIDDSCGVILSAHVTAVDLEKIRTEAWAGTSSS